MQSVTSGSWVLAAAPIVLLFVLVVSGKVRMRNAAALVLVLVVVVAATAFEAGPRVLAIGLGKGLWLGTWILGVMIPALLLYRIATAAGIERIGTVLRDVVGGEVQALLAFAWLVPAFVQGVAGFGTPIAVAAPLLVASGWSPVRAVTYTLVGYHWSVTFGSMGSSFYMASLTAGFDASSQGRFALTAATMLTANALLAGAIVLLMDGGPRRLREGAPVLIGVGLPMGATLVFVATTVPAVATLSAATVGLAALLVLARVRRSDGDLGGTAARGLRTVARLMAPYLLLLAVALAVLLPPPTRRWVSDRLVLGPSFPSTTTGTGWENPAVEVFTPLAVLAHPGTYIAFAALGGWLVYRRLGLWGVEARAARPVRVWARTAPAAAVPVLLLASLAMVLVDAGMIAVLARGIATTAGDLYPVLAPAVGALGSFMTGATTSSNALFSALQADIARILEVPEPALIAAQTVGGNVGNSIAPVVALLGVTAVGEPDAVAEVLRAAGLAAGVLLAATAVWTVVAVAVLA